MFWIIFWQYLEILDFLQFLRIWLRLFNKIHLPHKKLPQKFWMCPPLIGVYVSPLTKWIEELMYLVGLYTLKSNHTNLSCLVFIIFQLVSVSPCFIYFKLSEVKPSWDHTVEIADAAARLMVLWLHKLAIDTSRKCHWPHTWQWMGSTPLQFCIPRTLLSLYEYIHSKYLIMWWFTILKPDQCFN